MPRGEPPIFADQVVALDLADAELRVLPARSGGSRPRKAASRPAARPPLQRGARTGGDLWP